MADTYRWALRDIRHGKTYFFRNWKDVVRFVSDMLPSKSIFVKKDAG